jgi:hypothetical protein
LTRQYESNRIVHSATAVGAVAKGGKQQWNVVMLVLVIDTKTDDYTVQEPGFVIFLTLRIEVITGMENKFIFTDSEGFIFQQWFFTTAVSIGDGGGNGIVLAVSKKFDPNGHARATIGDIQYMCRQTSHTISSLSISAVGYQL